MDTNAFGIDPQAGGMSLLISGRVKSSENNVDKDTGEVSRMVCVVWMGGSKFIFCDPTDDLAQVSVGAMVVLAEPQLKGKKGLYGDRSMGLTLVSIGGKPVTQERKGAA